MLLAALSESILRITILWKTMPLGKIVEGGQFEIVWSSEKPIRPEPYPGSRSEAAWNEFLAALFREWNGHWTKSQN